MAASDDALLLERVLQSQGVDHRGEHAHVVGSRAVHALGARGDTAKDIAAANHNRRFDAHALNFSDVPGDLCGYGRIDAVALRAHQRFAG